MQIKINGKELEVGPSHHIQKELGLISSNQPSEKKTFQGAKLMINGREVDMNNPNDVQRAMRFCRMIGIILLLVAIVIGCVIVFNMSNWTDSKEDILIGGFVGFIWLLLGSVFTFFVPKSLQKRLQELKRQGKVPSKY